MNIVKNYKLKSFVYSIAFFVSFVQLFFGQFLDFTIIISSLVLFVYFIFTPKIDLYFLFIFLLPRLVFSGSTWEHSSDNDSSFLWFTFPLIYFKDTIILGPLALSNSLALSLAVPFRILFYFKRSNYSFLSSAWFISLILALIGLAFAVVIGLSNPSGLTVGFRIVLSIGAVLLPLAIEYDQFHLQVKKIIITSCILLILGIMKGHWIFILSGLLIILFFEKNIFYRVLSVFTAIILLVFGSTFTLQFTFLTSFIFSISLIKPNKKIHNRFSNLLFSLTPILLTAVFLSINYDPQRSLTGSYLERFYFKLFDDRKPLWDATMEQILNTQFWFAPAGRPLPILNYRAGAEEWTAGSHNIFLEIPRQIGNLASIIVIYILVIFIFKIGRNHRNRQDKLLYISLFSVYFVFGFSGNSLVYDGVGFLFWLIVGQFYLLNRKLIN